MVNKKLIILLSIFILIFSTVAIAIDQGRLPDNMRYVMGEDSSVSLGLFSTVAFGGACSDTPTDTGCVRPLPSIDTCNNYNLVKNFGGKVECSGEGVVGCRICFYDSKWQPKQWSLEYDSGGCRSKQSGHVYAPAGAYFWEKYNCVKDECKSYDTPSNQGCGEGSCEDNEMLRTYKDSCDNDHFFCVPLTTCREETCAIKYENIGDCVAGIQRKQLTFSDCTKGEIIETSCRDQEEETVTVTPTGTAIIFAENPTKAIKDGVLIESGVTLKNTGDNMNNAYIIEMQVRPKGTLPLSVVGATSTCDPEHPENVHRTFKLNKDETVQISLVTGKAMSPGWYTIYLATRTKCYKDLNSVERGNIDAYWRVNPYPNTLNLGNICIGDNCFDDDKTGFGSIYLIIGVVIISMLGYGLFRGKRKRR